MKLQPGLPISEPLQVQAERLLATAVEALKPRRGLVLVQLSENWTEAAISGIPGDYWKPEVVATEAIQTVASEWTAQLFADTGAPTDSPLAFLQGNLSSVLVIPGYLQEKKTLLYLARPFADGLYQDDHLELCRVILEGTPPEM